MKIGRSALPLFASVAALALMMGCHAHSYSEQYYAIATNTRLAYWQTAAAGFNKAATELGVKAELRGPDGYDPQAEVTEFHNMVARKPAGILVSVADPALMQGEINSAIAAGIPVITIDSDAPNSQRLFFIGTNNLTAGRLGGARLAEKLNGKGNVVFFTNAGQPNLVERLKGYQDIISAHPGMHVVEVFDMKGDTGTALDKTTEYLARTGEKKIDGFVCLEAAAGKDVAEAFRRANATGRELIAMDVDQATLDLVKSGVIDATVAQKPYTMTYYGLKALGDLKQFPLKSLQTNYQSDPFSPIPSFVDTGSELVSAANVDTFLKARQGAQAP